VSSGNEGKSYLRESQSNCAADQREQQCFGEQQAYEASSTCAESGADGEFALPSGVARQK
jgi:hypothetical protein